MKQARDIVFSDISVGDTVSTTHTITEDMVATFAALSGDYNPLHTDEGYAASTPHGKRVVHGMLVVSFFSECIGMQLPGKRSLIVEQKAKFRAPTFIGDTITVKGEVIHKSPATNTVTMTLSALRDTTLLVIGEVVVLVT